MVVKDHRKPASSPEAAVGEIDTSAPFQSVKDAVTLLGEGAFSGERLTIKKPKVQSAEGVLAKESVAWTELRRGDEWADGREDTAGNREGRAND